jgi:GT2 family glycosyltransferase
MPSTAATHRVSAIVLAYGAEPLLETAVRALLASRAVEMEVIVVDNGCTDGGVQRVAALPGVRVERPAENLGFAAGCDWGAATARGDLLAFVNGDAVAAPEALERLAAIAERPDVAIASASLRLADDPTLLNSAGNVVHFLGFSWCGGFGQPATAFAEERDVTAATGAAMMLRRTVWEGLGGFEGRYFAYHEDTDLSIRAWQRGLRVVFVPDAEVVHRYEFARNPDKWYLAERNRLITVLSTFEGRTLALLAPLLVLTELGMLGVALRRGWAQRKVAGWIWIARHWRWLARRRRSVQASRQRSDRELAGLFATRLDTEYVGVPRVVRPVEWLFARYWDFVVRHTATNSL